MSFSLPPSMGTNRTPSAVTWTSISSRASKSTVLKRSEKGVPENKQTSSPSPNGGSGKGLEIIIDLINVTFLCWQCALVLKMQAPSRTANISTHESMKGVYSCDV